LAPQDTDGHAVDWLLASAQKDFPVVDGGRVVGLVLHGDLPGAIAGRGAQIPVAEIMHRDFQVVDSHEMLELAFKRLQTCDCHTMPVIHQDRLVGLMTMDNMGEFLALQAGRGARASPVLRRSA
jgi:predicted transcriptional regulator